MFQMYLVLALAIGEAVIFALALYAAKKHKAFLERKSALNEAKQSQTFKNGSFIQTKF